MMKRLIPVLFLIAVFSCKNVVPPVAIGPLPSDRQLVWHEMEFYAFVHFNMNTFSNKEWGFGDEIPALFNPSELDCRQWARVCRDAGMKGIILTAKHHDGFCLWPSAYTEHSVKNSPWKDGKGDVVKELADACREYGLKMGVYLSPWDRNHPDYGKPEYLEYFRNQLRELLTQYGDIFEVWFDGANGGTGYYGGANEERRIDRKTYYDWENTWEIVRELQPGACMFSDAGPDIRWVGNEQGWARETNWCLLKKDDFAPGIVSDLELLRSGQEDGTHWLPAEVDVSIRPGWYYHEYEDHKVKSLPQLLDIYYQSVGRNASLLLNFPVDRRGLIHEKDVEQVMKLAEAIKSDFAENLISGITPEASDIRGNSKKFGPSNVTDNNPETYWAANDGVTQASLVIDFGQETEFNRFLAQEYIPLGQRVQSFTLEVFSDGQWKQIDSQTTIGRKRILRFPNVRGTMIRMNITAAKACPVIAEIAVYKAPRVVTEPGVIRDQLGTVSLQTYDKELQIYYTLDGTDPGQQSTLYSGPFPILGKAVLKTVAIDPDQGKMSPQKSVEFDVAPVKWKVGGAYADMEKANLMFDGDPSTAFSVNDQFPVDFVFDLGESRQLTGFRYTPDQGRSNPGVIFQYEFSVSNNGRSWSAPVKSGEFSNIQNSPVQQSVDFTPVPARYVRLRALAPAYENGRAGIAEFEIITL